MTQTNRNETWTKRAAIRLTAMTLLLMPTLMLLPTGCASSKVVEISSDRMVRTVKAGAAFTPPCDGKFVPEARWKEMLDVYVRASEAK